MVEFKWNGEHRTKSGLTVHDYCCSPRSAGISAVGGTGESPVLPQQPWMQGGNPRKEQQDPEWFPRASSPYQNLCVMQFAGMRWNFGFHSANRNFIAECNGIILDVKSPGKSKQSKTKQREYFQAACFNCFLIPSEILFGYKEIILSIGGCTKQLLLFYPNWLALRAF